MEKIKNKTKKQKKKKTKKLHDEIISSFFFFCFNDKSPFRGLFNAKAIAVEEQQ